MTIYHTHDNNNPKPLSVACETKRDSFLLCQTLYYQKCFNCLKILLTLNLMKTTSTIINQKSPNFLKMLKVIMRGSFYFNHDLCKTHKPKQTYHNLTESFAVNRQFQLSRTVMKESKIVEYSLVT